MNININSDAYLTFALGKENFAIPVEHVQEIVELDQVTQVPNAPAYMLGIINLRGRILPLFDTKLKLGLPRTEITKRSRVMVLCIKTEDNKNLEVGALVDVAREVQEYSPSEIQPTPEVHESNSSLITGIINDHGHITMMVDIGKVFTTEELLQINK
jgi:purine-binding chemotaxis protein CheW